MIFDARDLVFERYLQMTRSNEGLMNDGKQRGSSSVVFKYTWDRDKTYVAINMRLTISGQDRSIKIRYAIVGRTQYHLLEVSSRRYVCWNLWRGDLYCRENLTFPSLREIGINR